MGDNRVVNIPCKFIGSPPQITKRRFSWETPSAENPVTTCNLECNEVCIFHSDPNCVQRPDYTNSLGIALSDKSETSSRYSSGEYPLCQLLATRENNRGRFYRTFDRPFTLEAFTQRMSDPSSIHTETTTPASTDHSSCESLVYIPATASTDYSLCESLVYIPPAPTSKHRVRNYLRDKLTSCYGGSKSGASDSEDQPTLQPTQSGRKRDRFANMFRSSNVGTVTSESWSDFDDFQARPSISSPSRHSSTTSPGKRQRLKSFFSPSIGVDDMCTNPDFFKQEKKVAEGETVSTKTEAVTRTLEVDSVTEASCTDQVCTCPSVSKSTGFFKSLGISLHLGGSTRMSEETVEPAAPTSTTGTITAEPQESGVTEIINTIGNFLIDSASTAKWAVVEGSKVGFSATCAGVGWIAGQTMEHAPKILAGTWNLASQGWSETSAAEPGSSQGGPEGGIGGYGTD